MLTSNAFIGNPSIWHQLDKSAYNIILALPKVVLGPQSWFWQKTVQEEKNRFYHRLKCITIDKVYIIWSWQNFREKYWMLGYLKNVFSKVSTLIISATIIPNILDYIRIFLKLLPLSRIYRLPLDRPNLKYMVYPIQKLGFWNLVFLILKDGLVGLILKIMIFVNKIEDTIRLKRYL